MLQSTRIKVKKMQKMTKIIVFCEHVHNNEQCAVKSNMLGVNVCVNDIHTQTPPASRDK
jgi:hypothetical protein